jgi:hypothetical protein
VTTGWAVRNKETGCLIPYSEDSDLHPTREAAGAALREACKYFPALADDCEIVELDEEQS